MALKPQPPRRLHEIAGQRLLRLPAVIERTGLSRAAIHSKWRRGTFPPPLKISERAVAWSERSIDIWISSLSPAPARQADRALGE
jgi:prophage regulatory protein